jgi:hypothetical protein
MMHVQGASRRTKTTRKYIPDLDLNRSPLAEKFARAFARRLLPDIPLQEPCETTSPSTQYEKENTCDNREVAH